VIITLKQNIIMKMGRLIFSDPNDPKIIENAKEILLQIESFNKKLEELHLIVFGPEASRKKRVATTERPKSDALLAKGTRSRPSSRKKKLA
jgi:hypothetical protein